MRRELVILATACALCGSGCDKLVGLVAPITTLPDAASDEAGGPAPDGEPVGEAAMPVEAAADSTATPVDAPNALDAAEGGDAPDDAETLIPVELGLDGGPCDPLHTLTAVDAGSCDPLDDGDEAGCRPGYDLGNGGPGFGDLSYAPPVHQNLCSPAQIDQIYDSCIAHGLVSSLECQVAFPGLADLTSCQQCLFAGERGGAGPFIADGSGGQDYDYYFVNVAGCVALVEPCNTACAQNIAATLACTSDSCAYICEGAGASVAQVAACQSAAETCPCMAQEALSSACVESIQQRGSPAAFCLGLSNAIQPYEAAPTLSATQLVTLMTLFCGGS